MARTHRHDERLDLPEQTDPWPLVERVESYLTHRVQTIGTGSFGGSVTVEDSGGSGRFHSVAEAKADYENGRHEVKQIRLLVLENFVVAEPGADVSADRLGIEALHTYIATFSNDSFGTYMELSGQGPDEAEAVGVAEVMLREVKAALVARVAESLRPREVVVGSEPVRAARLTLPEAVAVPRWKQALNHPWTVTLVGGVIVGLILLWVGLKAS